MGVKDPAIKMPSLRMFRSLYETFDRDVLSCFRYIEPTKANVEERADMIEVYSVELYRLHIDICAAIDSLLHLWYVSKWGQKETTINDYYPLLEELDIQAARELKLRRNSEIRVKPLVGWTADAVPGWWTDHNKTKHNLDPGVFPKGNLRNVVYSLGAFYLLLNDEGTRGTNPISTQVFIPAW